MNDIPDHLIISATNIQLMDPIGQGLCISLMIKANVSVGIIYVGEFGVVYKGHIVKGLGQSITNVVAVKTLKGEYQRLYMMSWLGSGNIHTK